MQQMHEQSKLLFVPDGTLAEDTANELARSLASYLFNLSERNRWNSSHRYEVITPSSAYGDTGAIHKISKYLMQMGCAEGGNITLVIFAYGAGANLVTRALESTSRSRINASSTAVLTFNANSEVAKDAARVAVNLLSTEDGPPTPQLQQVEKSGKSIKRVICKKPASSEKKPKSSFLAFSTVSSKSSMQSAKLISQVMTVIEPILSELLPLFGAGFMSCV